MCVRAALRSSQDIGYPKNENTLYASKTFQNRGRVNMFDSFGLDVLERGMAQITDSDLETSHQSR